MINEVFLPRPYILMNYKQLVCGVNKYGLGRKCVGSIIIFYINFTIQDRIVRKVAIPEATTAVCWILMG